jgi:hypothetical protein
MQVALGALGSQVSFGDGMDKSWLRQPSHPAMRKLGHRTPNFCICQLELRQDGVPAGARGTITFPIRS